MSTPRKAIRRSARRIGVEQGASFEERRHIILREAARAFNANGVERTSLDALASRLGVTKPAIYHYVSGKNELITQCLRVAMADLTNLLDRVDAMEASGLEKIIYAFARWAEYVATDFGRAMVIIQQSNPGEESSATIIEAQRLMLRRIEQLIERGIADGSVRECVPSITALGLLALFNSPAHWPRLRGSGALPEAIAQLVELAREGMRSR